MPDIFPEGSFYHVIKGPTFIPILRQMHPVSNLTRYTVIANFNIIS